MPTLRPRPLVSDHPPLRSHQDKASTFAAYRWDAVSSSAGSASPSIWKGSTSAARDPLDENACRDLCGQEQRAAAYRMIEHVEWSTRGHEGYSDAGSHGGQRAEENSSSSLIARVSADCGP